MIEPIVIKVVDKVPIVVSGPQYVVCDNSDYTVVWQLDEEWAQFESRTMQVNYKDGTYERVLFTGNSCTIPAIPVPGPVHVGLFAGDIHTTRPARLLAVRSATTDCGEERDPMSNGYAQAIKALDGKLDKNQGADNAGKALVVGDDGTVVPGKAQGSSLPAMSSDTAGKMLTNDGKKAEWGGAVRYDVKQELLGGVQQQARQNIGAFPGKTLQYFFDTTTGSKHDNDIVAADVYDVIAPGNTYSDGTHSNAGMEFPAYVMSSRNLAQDYYEMRLLDNNGAVWNVVINKSTKAFHDCSKISGKQVMCVNFTQDDDGNWSADKNWDDAAALIEAGGYVYAMLAGISFPLSAYLDNNLINFTAVMLSPSGIRNNVFRWHQDGTIEAVLDAFLPVVMYGEQTLTADQQAQARKNIGAGTPYDLPIADADTLGGVKPVAKTDAMTRSIGVDTDGGLYTEPGAWYVTIMQTALGSPDATADKTPQEIVAAYQAGYSIYANIVVTPDANATDAAIAPIVFGDLDSFTVVFSTVRSMRFLKDGAVAFYAMFVDGGWRVNRFELAKTADIPDAYTLPVASPTQLGGVKPVAKTDAMTRGVGVDSNGGLYTEPDSVYYIDLKGTFPNFTTSKTNAEIHSAYQSGRTLVCRFYQDDNRWTLPLLSPTLGLWLFGAVISTGKPVDVDAAQGIAAIVGNGQGIVTQVDLAIKADIPAALPNPNALTITIGDNVVSYDGSAAKAVTIPTGGSSGGETWELINTFDVAEADAARVIKIDKDSNGNAFSLKEFAFRAVTNSTKTDGSVYGWFCVNGSGTYNSGLGGFQTNYVRHPSTGAAIANDVIGRALPCGLVYDQSTGSKAAEGIAATTVTEVHEVEFAGYQSTENLLYGTFSLWGVRK